MIATATVLSGVVGIGAGSGHTVVLKDAYRARLDEMAQERDRNATEARSAQDRFRVAVEQIGEQQTAILEFGRGAA